MGKIPAHDGNFVTPKGQIRPEKKKEKRRPIKLNFGPIGLNPQLKFRTYIYIINNNNNNTKP